MRNSLKLLLAGSLLSLSFSAPVFACSCAIPGTTVEEIQNADAVFSGTAATIQEDFNYGEDVYFEVDQSWKGVETNKIKVHTGFGGGDCGYPFEEGKEYLVFATQNEGEYEAGTCGLTQSLNDADTVIEALGSGTTMVQAEEEPWVSQKTLQVVAVLSLVALVSLATVTRLKKK